MKKTSIVLLAATLFFAACRADAGDPVKDDLDKLRGEWVPVKATANGRDVEIPKGADLSKLSISADGQNLTTQGQTGTFTIDPSTTPKTMRCSLVSDSTWSYRIEGDSLTIAFGTVGAKAPPDLDGKDGNYVVAYRRAAK